MSGKIFWIFYLFSCIIVLSTALINVELTVLQYDNPLGTSYTSHNTQGDRKCCDVGGASCTATNDTCDVFFTFCIGRMSNDPSKPGCIGASIDMSQDVSNNVFSIKTGKQSGLTRYGNLSDWTVNQTSITVEVLDIDLTVNGGTSTPDLIDNFTRPLAFSPSASYWASPKHIIHLQQHVSLDLQIRVWCADGWYGNSCNLTCYHDNYHTCSDGRLVPLLECSDSERVADDETGEDKDEIMSCTMKHRKYWDKGENSGYLYMLVLPILKPAQEISSLATIKNDLYGFIADYVCPAKTRNVSLQLKEIRSKGLSQTDIVFNSSCDGVRVSRLKFQEMVYVFSVVTSRLPSLNTVFGVPVKPPRIPFISASQSSATILVQLRIIYYENRRSKNCNMGTQGAYCNPRLTVDFRGNNGVTGHINVRTADKFVDCNGAAVDTNDRNISQVDNSTLLFSLIKFPDYIRIAVSDIEQTSVSLASYGLQTNQTKVGTNFLDAMTHIYVGSQGYTNISVEVLAWCSNCFHGDRCQYKTQNCQRGVTVIPPDCTSSSDCNHGKCINNTCVCQGWVGAMCNIDIDECELGFCKHAQTCINTPGNYSCVCAAGFTGQDCEMDVNECESDPCTGGSVCLNTYGSYSCICSNGTVSDHCFVDFCASGPCHNNAACTNHVDATFNCICAAGWSGTLCDQDVNECLNDSTCLHGGVCHNMEGSFYCDCPSNFTGTHCEGDVNECDLQNVCDNNGTCVNTVGGFNCSCLPQWTGPTCEEDVDECQTELNSCFKGECVNTNGSFHCKCYSGWMGDNCTQDLDECNMTDHNPCFHNGSCLNTQGSFQCICPQTWTGPHCRQDVDECDVDLMACFMNGNCTNTQGGYSCSCQSGWTGEHCDGDIDECTSTTTTCQNNGSCTNTVGGYRCTCLAAWTGINCDSDFNECQTNPCYNGGTCQNSPGSFTCVCPSNWTGPLCDQDVNECQGHGGLGPCLHGNCVNSVGGFLCVCPSQWTGRLCESDNNECVVFTPCQHDGVCTDMQGGYSCACTTAWSGINCTDNLDECSQYPGICQHGGICSDVSGDYLCSCGEGYTGKNCSDDLNECVDIGACNSHGVCINSVGSYSCNCTAGWSGSICGLDVDECQDTGVCNNHGACTNTAGSYKCQCDPGWTGSVCSIDVDECIKNPCLRGNCTNTPGSFTCVCNPGWKGDNCETNVNDCLGINCSGHGQCVDLVNDYHCKCDYGFSGIHCAIDDDECEQQPCLNAGVCSDHEGYYQCACPAGWNGTNCELDVDECKLTPCKSTEVCVNSKGGYSCNPVHFNKPSTTVKVRTTQMRTTKTRTVVTEQGKQGETKKQTSGTNIIPIAGGAGGGVILVVVLIAIIIIVRRKKADTPPSNREFQNVEVNEIEDMDGSTTLTFGNPTYNTLYHEHTSI